jgi:curved DNA-binding protein CbpA
MLQDEAQSLYDTLQVSPRASPEVIRAAYRTLARAHHPDTSADGHSAGRMRDINAAYDVLSDPERRAEYDLRRARAARAVRSRRTGRAARSSRASAERAGHVRYERASRPVGRLVLAAAIVVAVLVPLTLLCWLLLAELDDRPPGGYYRSADVPALGPHLGR